MNRQYATRYSVRHFFWLTALTLAALLPGCKEEKLDLRIKQFDPGQTAKMAATIEALVKPEMEAGLTLRLWGTDSLVASPIAIDVDDSGRIFYTTTSRANHSEFDIRGHQDWEIPSIQLQTVEDRRAFLRKELSPENSTKNTWLKDLNCDGSHDWRDLTVEKEKIFRLDDRNGDGVADLSQLVVEDFNDEVTDVAGGVLAYGNNLFLGVGPNLWRMRDKNGDGIADEKESLSHGYGVHIGFSGHGMSGVEMGPDGRIYWQIGDIGFNGTDKDGKRWEYPNSGVIARSNPDGSDFEIFASGLRNTHEFAFDQYGNLISEDNDGDHPGEKERLVYIVNGSDAGWRSNWQYGKYRDPDNNTYKVWMDEKLWLPRHAGTPAYITPCIANYVSGPAGFVYNPGGALSSRYRNTFFVAEFVGNPAKSGVYAFQLTPKGAGFALGENKKILGGVLPTGLDFGPDGALYVADWIDGWGTSSYGRIWKLDDTQGALHPQRTAIKKLLAENFATKSGRVLGQLLAHDDMRVRQKAQFELVSRGSAGAAVFQQALRQRQSQLARVHAIWGLAQMARKDAKVGRQLIPLLQDPDAEIRAQAAKWLGDIRLASAAKSLLPLLRDTFSRARFFAAEALGRIAYEPATAAIIAMLRENNDEDAYLRHAGSLALARMGKPAPLMTLASDSSAAVRVAAVVALRRMSHPGVAVFLNDNNEFIVTEAARAINDDRSIPKAIPALGNLLNTTRFTNEALIRRAINANLRTGTPEGLQNLLRFAEKAGQPANLRAETVAAISTWSQPSVVDRVDGWYRGVIKRNPATVKNAAGDVLIRLLKDNNSEVQTSAIKALTKLNVSEATAALRQLFNKSAQAAVRVEVLKALASLHDEKMSQTIKQALSDKDKAVRVVGIDLIDQLSIHSDLKVTLLANVINTKTSEEKQAALKTLATIPVQYSGPVLEELLRQMERGKLASEIILDLEEAIDSTRLPGLQTRYKQISASRSPDDVMAAYAGALDGGDAGRGKQIFFSHESAQCLRCHSYDDMGGNAGPRLNGVAARLTRPQLLEALVNPSARLAPGYGMVTLTLKNGKTVAGVLQEETNNTLVIKRSGQYSEVVPKASVAKRVNAASSMPEMRYLLSKKEIRDVVSFLATLKE